MTADPTPAAAAADAWTTRSLLKWMTDAFDARDLDSPRLMAELLLSHVLDCDRMRLYMEADRPASPEERDTLRGLVARALRHEPVQYLVGEAWFYSAPFFVDRRVLIPRPSTATLVEAADRFIRAQGFDSPRCLDLCTGSGCIAITLLKQIPTLGAVATDLSQDALDVATINAERHGVSDRLSLRRGDLFLAVDDGAPPFDVVVANPPYIPDHEWDDVAPNVRNHEPHEALRASPDGLPFVRSIVRGAPRFLKPGGRLYIEIAACTAAAAERLVVEAEGLTFDEVESDFEDLPRVLAATAT